MTTAISRPGLPRVRHGFLAAALLAVAALRLSLGDLVWAGILAAAGLVEVYVAYASARRATQAPATAAAPVALPPADQLDRTLLRQRQGQQLWTGLLAASVVAAALVVTAEPSLAIVLGCLALFCLFRVRRARRSATGARLLLARARGGTLARSGAAPTDTT